MAAGDSSALDAAYVLRRGLDLSSLDTITDDEKRAVADTYLKVHGRPSHPGLSFWLEHDRPGPAKRYRVWTNLINQPPAEPIPHTTVLLAWYAMQGYEEGVGYIVHRHQVVGMTQSQHLDAVALMYLWGGPLAMEVYAKATAGLRWDRADAQPEFAPGWGPDHEALVSGLDFSKPGMADNELRQLEDWHLRWEGEVPRYVRFLGRYRPDFLKAYRSRLENTLYELPKQLLPYTMIGLNVMRGSGWGIREGVLLARGFGMSREDAVRAACWGTLMGGPEAISQLDEVAGDVFSEWS
jgi:hypothetical protein